MTAQQIKVAIADDHKIFRDGIRMALKDKDYLKIIWEAEDVCPHILVVAAEPDIGLFVKHPGFTVKHPECMVKDI